MNVFFLSNKLINNNFQGSRCILEYNLSHEPAAYTCWPIKTGCSENTYDGRQDGAILFNR